jgi:hypothetical protein
MVYSEVVSKGLILPKREKYTMRDVNRVMIDSLFRPGQTLGYKEALFIVKCSAVYHGTDWSNPVGKAFTKHHIYTGISQVV